MTLYEIYYCHVSMLIDTMHPPWGTKDEGPGSEADFQPKFLHEQQQVMFWYTAHWLLIVGVWFLQNVELVGALWAFNFQKGFQTMFLGRLGHRGFIPRRVPWVSSQLESKKHSDDEEEERAFWAIRVALNDLRPGCTIPMTVTMTTRNSVQNILPLSLGIKFGHRTSDLCWDIVRQKNIDQKNTKICRWNFTPFFTTKKPAIRKHEVAK